jgi:hypothetical protein
MSGRRINYKIQIDWKKVKHIRPRVEDDKSISLELKPTTSPLPRVTVITDVNNPILFAFCVYSWNSVMYPYELLNWIIIDSKDKLTTESLGDSADDPRIRIVKKKFKSFDNAVENAMEMPWVNASEQKTEVSPSEPAVSPSESTLPQETSLELVTTPSPPSRPSPPPVERGHCYTLLDCGDVWFPDNLSLRFRALEGGYDCVIADTLAYYSPLDNTSLAFKLFLKFPRGGLYFKKRWWKNKSSQKMIGVPYLANCVSIGRPSVHAMPIAASARFFDNFPTDIKVMIRKIMRFLYAQRDELDSSSDEEDDSPLETNV